MSFWNSQAGKTLRDSLVIGGPVVLMEVSYYLLSDQPFSWRTLAGIAVGSFIAACLRHERFKNVPAPQVEIKKTEDDRLAVTATDPKTGRTTEQTVEVPVVMNQKTD